MATYAEKLHRVGFGDAKIDHRISAMRAQQSHRAGVPELHL